MATRLYFPSSGTPLVTPATWNFGAQINPLSLKGGTYSNDGTASTADVQATGTTNPTARGMLRYVYGPLAAQTIAGTIKGQILAAESATGANATVALAIKIIAPDGTDRAVLLAQTSSTNTATTPPEMAATVTNRRFLDSSDNAALALTSQSAQAGDYLVVEIGFRSATGTTRNITLQYGNNNTTDLPEDDTTTATDNPWIEFSQTLNFFQPTFFKYPHKERGPFPFPMTTPPFVPTATNNVTAALSGVAATMAIGVLSAAFSLVPTGAQANTGIGLGPTTVDVATTGVSGTTAVGTEIPGFSFALSGQSATGSVGTVTSPGWSLALTGVAGTTAAGTEIAAPSFALGGFSATGSPGSFSGLSDVIGLGGLVGASGIGTQTIPSAPVNVDRPMILRGPFPFPMAVPAWPVNAPVSGTVALTGVQASVIVNDFNDVLADLAPFAGLQASALLGSVGPSTPGSAPLVGVAGTGQAGTLTANLPLPLVGQQGTGAVGTELPIASYIDRPAYVQGPFPFLPSSGTFWFREKPRPILPQSQSITVILGSVTAAGQVNGLGVKNDTNALAGDVGTGTLGTEIAAFSEPITGVTATGSVGSLGLAQPLTGSSATGQTGTEIANFSVPLTGVTASGQLGVLAANSNSDVTLQLSGVGSTSAIGTLAVTATLAVSGQSATSAIGSLSVTVARLLVGPVATGAIGTPSGSGSGSASLAGVQAAATINPIANVSEIILPPGLAAQGYAGALAFSPATFMVTGVTANGIAGSLSIDEGAVLDLVGQFLPTLDFTGELD